MKPYCASRSFYGYAQESRKSAANWGESAAEFQETATRIAEDCNKKRKTMRKRTCKMQTCPKKVFKNDYISYKLP